MKDINTPLQKAYYDAIGALSIPVFEGEEPNNTNEPIYVVLHDINGTDASTKNSTDYNCSIQVSVHSIKNNVNNSIDINDTVNDILTALKPDPNAVLDLSADNLQMTELVLTVDRTSRSKFGDTAFISRDLIFNQTIFIKD